MRDLQGDRQALVPGMQAALGPLLAVRHGRAGPRGTADAPLCSPCARPDAGFWRSCPGCGQAGRITAGRCVSCRLRQRLRDLLGGPDGTIRPGLQALHDNLAGYERPATVLGWLHKSTAAAILRELGAGQWPLTHAALDELPDGKPLRHLRAVLVATGALPPRDEHMARLERWISWSIAERPDPGQRQLLHRYAVWHVVRRLRGRSVAHTPPTARSWPPSATSRPPSPCSTGSPPATSPSPRPAKATWRNGWPTPSRPTAPTPGTSSAGHAGTN